MNDGVKQELMKYFSKNNKIQARWGRGLMKPLFLGSLNAANLTFSGQSGLTCLQFHLIWHIMWEIMSISVSLWDTK